MRSIPVIVHDGDETDARLWEIAENLHRADLTEEQRRQHIAEWVRLTAERVAHGEQPSPGGRQPRDKAISKAASELGLHRMAVSRAVAAESLAPEVKAVADKVNAGTVARAQAAAQPTAEEQIRHLQETPRTKLAV